MSVFFDVAHFMQIAHPDKISAVARIPPESIKELCWKLIKEEYTELELAKDANDLVEVADAIADLIWVAICMAQCYGIPLHRVWAEVNKTNMAKFPDGKVIRREDGKILKPDGWKPPDIALIVNEAMPCTNCGTQFRSGMSERCMTPECQKAGE